MIPMEKFDEAKHKEAMSIYTKNLLEGTEQHSENANSGISVTTFVAQQVYLMKR